MGKSRVCRSCTSLNFRLVDDSYYCRDCGLKHSKNASLNRIKSKSGKRVEKILQGKSVPWVTVEAFQIILKAHVQMLIEMGFSPDLDSIVEQIWFKFLDCGHHVNMLSMAPRQQRQVSYRDFFIGKLGTKNSQKLKTLNLCIPRRNRKRKLNALYAYASDDSSSENQSQRNDEAWFSAITDEESEQATSLINEYRKLKKRNQRLSHVTGWEILTLPKILAFCFIGLQWCGELVTPADLIVWAKSGVLPYKDAMQYLPAHMKLSSAANDHNSIPCEIPTHQFLTLLSDSVHHYISMPALPDTDMKLLLARFLHQLNLPLSLIPILDMLRSQVPYSRSSIKQLVTKGHRVNACGYARRYLPDVFAAALILVALKILFEIDDNNEFKKIKRKQCNVHNNHCDIFSFNKWLLQHNKTKFKRELRIGVPEIIKHPDRVGDVHGVMENFNKVQAGSTLWKIPSHNISEKIQKYQRKEQKLKHKILTKLQNKQGSTQEQNDITLQRETLSNLYGIHDSQIKMTQCCIFPAILQARKRAQKSNSRYWLYTTLDGNPCNYLKVGSIFLYTDSFHKNSLSETYKDLVNIMCALTCAKPLAINEFVLMIEHHAIFNELTPLKHGE